VPPPVTQKQQSPQLHDEMILVVKRHTLLGTTAWHGLQHVNMETCMQIINEKREFLPRSLMETDQNYKQIIPYLIFKHSNRYFLMQRRTQASEKRLQNKYSLGIGGHIRKEDCDGATIFDWAKREFHEEVTHNGNLTITPLGLLNDDTNAVGRVHIGLVLLLESDSDTIAIKSELKSGQLLTLAECAAYVDTMETWSQIVYAYLIKNDSPDKA